MKRKFWLGTLALAATLCCSVGMANVSYTANAEETAVETPVAEASFELLDETASFDNSNAKLQYDTATKTGTVGNVSWVNKNFKYATQELVQMADGSVKKYNECTTEFSVTYSNIGTLATTANILGVQLTSGSTSVAYRVQGAIEYGKSSWLALKDDLNSPFANETQKGNYRLGTTLLASTTTIKVVVVPKIGDVNGSITFTVNGTEMGSIVYEAAEQITFGLVAQKNTADISNASLKIVGATGWYVEPETKYDLLGYDKAQHSVESDGATAETKYSYDFANKVGYIGGSASGIGVAEKERAKAYFKVSTPDKVVAKDDTLIDYSAVEKMGLSITYSDIQAVDGTFDAKNNNEFIAIALCNPNADNDWAGLWVMGEQNYNHIGVLERNLKGTGLFANGDTTATIRFGGKTSPVVDGSITLSILVTKATDDAVGSIEVLWNGVTATTFGYSGKVFPDVGMYSRGVSAKVSNVSYELYGVKGVHEHTEETLSAVAATCTTDGLTEGKKCTVCGMTTVAQETVPATHTTTKTEAVAPTCTEAGNIAYWTCSGVCGKTYSDEACTVEVTDTVVPAAGHNTTKTDAQAATCTAEGNIAFWFCNTCSKIYSDEAYTTEITAEQAIIAATGHTEETLSAVAPTCTETGLTEGKKCTVCDTITVAQEEVAEAGHTEETLAAVAPTCTETGLTEGKKCTVCDTITVAQEEVAEAGHTEETLAAVAPTCTETGLTEGKKCTVCDTITVAQEEVPATGHTESDWIVDTEAQVGVAGSKHKECTVCGETLATEEIPALEAPETSSDDATSEDKTESASNGQPSDSTLVGCFGTIGGLSASIALMGVAAVAFLRKKED